VFLHTPGLRCRTRNGHVAPVAESIPHSCISFLAYGSWSYPPSLATASRYACPSNRTSWMQFVTAVLRYTWWLHWVVRATHNGVRNTVGGSSVSAHVAHPCWRVRFACCMERVWRNVKDNCVEIGLMRQCRSLCDIMLSAVIILSAVWRSQILDVEARASLESPGTTLARPRLPSRIWKFRKLQCS
jgi:hypothetical protein